MYSLISRNFSSSGNIINILKIGQVTCIGLNRIKNKNCINEGLLTKLRSVLHDFENDTTSNAGVIYGEMGNFSYGYDQNDVSISIQNTQDLLIDITDTFCKKPLVAALSGFAVGPGFDLALWCDFRIVEETAVMYARTFGIPIRSESGRRLISLVGLDRALDWTLSGRIVKADEALQCGIATRIVPCGTAIGQAVNFAASLCNKPQACLRADRATLLLLTEKFPPKTKCEIQQEKEKNLSLALSEVNDGVHVTTSDVRLRHE